MQSRLKKQRESTGSGKFIEHDMLSWWFVPVYTRYTLEVGELSEPVYTDSGIHIILRTA